MKYCVGIGQDSHRFHSDASNKICVIGGLQFHEVPGFLANSDGDVIFHAICNAISSVTGIPIMGALADELCLKQGITDSAIYLEAALKTLKDLRICHIALTLEGLKPKFLPRLEELRTQIAHVMHIEKTQVGLTATTGEGLTDFGRGDGVQCFAIVTFMGI